MRAGTRAGMGYCRKLLCKIQLLDNLQITIDNYKVIMDNYKLIMDNYEINYR